MKEIKYGRMILHFGAMLYQNLQPKPGHFIIVDLLTELLGNGTKQ